MDATPDLPRREGGCILCGSRDVGPRKITGGKVVSWRCASCQVLIGGDPEVDHLDYEGYVAWLRSSPDSVV